MSTALESQLPQADPLALGPAPLLCAGWAFTKHAIKRYRERTGCKKSDEKIMNKLVVQLANKKRCGRGQWYASGWVFVHRGNLIITVMRPKAAKLQKRIFNAHNETSPSVGATATDHE